MVRVTARPAVKSIIGGGGCISPPIMETNMNRQYTIQGKRGLTEIRGVTYRQLYDIVRRKLDWYHPDRSDPVAFCQDMCCQIEKIQGIYPNVDQLTETTHEDQPI